MPPLVYRKNSASPWIKQGDRLTKTFSSGLCLIQQTYIAPKALATYNAFVEGASITDSQPCIDGAYIYPAPDYQDTGDGFVRCTLTAYGRWKTEPNVTRQKRKLELAVYGQVSNMPRGVFQEGGPTGPVTVYFVQTLLGGGEYPLNKKEIIADDLVLSFVMPQNVDLPLTPPNSLSRLYEIDGQIIPEMIDINAIMGFFGGTLKYNYENVGGYITITPTEYDSASVGYSSFSPQEIGVSLKLTRCESVEYGYFSEYTASFEATGNSLTKKPLLFRKK